MLRVAIVGCGKIADAHASQIQRLEGCEIVGVCDREPLMARQLAQRFPVQRCFGDVAELLVEARPDVVHITTPPESHFDIATRCLESGCHVYIEKPLTLQADEAHAIVALARARGRKLTVGHDDQFSHVARRMRALIGSGYLGGPPVHMDSYFCYELGHAQAQAIVSDETNWVRRLPGGLLQNIISHGIARIAEFMVTDSPQVMACGFQSALLRGIGRSDVVDELRVLIREPEGATAYFTFSTEMHPSLHHFSIYGPANGLLVDQDHETLIKLRGAAFTSYAQQFVPPVLFARQHLANLAANVRTFLARDFHMKAGMKYLIEAFYRSITEDAPVPIPYREILLTSTIMDRIFEQLRGQDQRHHVEGGPYATPLPDQLAHL